MPRERERESFAYVAVRGVQIVARRGHDEDALAAAAFLE
jgi:hypothetical protein